MTDVDRFERELTSVVRDGAPDAAPAALRERVRTSTTAKVVRPSTRSTPWLLGAAMGAALLLVVAVVWPRPAHGPGATPRGSALVATVDVSPMPSSGRATPVAGPVTHPGEVQVGELLTATDGWVYNTNGHVFITNSAGDTWRELTPPGLDPDGPFVPSFLDPDHGWVAQPDRDGGEKLLLWRTGDAGWTWAMSQIEGAQLVLGGLRFIDGSTGYLTTDPGGQHPQPELRWTHDAGATWSGPIDLAAATGVPTLQIVDFFNEQSGVMTGDVLLHTSDGGHTWSAPPVANTDFEIVSGTPRYGAVRIIDARTGYVVIDWLDPAGKTLGQTIIETTDGGASWVARYGDARHRWWAFVNEPHWIATDGVTVWSTSDGGGSWASDVSSGLPDVLDFANMQFVDPMHGWADAAGGPLIKCVACPIRVFELYKTADGGRTWSLVGDCDTGSELAFACPTPGPGETPKPS